MEETVVKPKKREATKSRINLKRNAFERVSRWAEQIKGSRKGVKVRASDLVEYVLMSHSEELANAEVKEYQERYTSDVDLAKWLVKELTAAEKRGEKLSISDLVASSKPRISSERATKRREISNEKSDVPEIKS